MDPEVAGRDSAAAAHLRRFSDGPAYPPGATIFGLGRRDVIERKKKTTTPLTKKKIKRVEGRGRGRGRGSGGGGKAVAFETLHRRRG